MKTCRFKHCCNEVTDHKALLCEEHIEELMKVKRPSSRSVGNWFNCICSAAKGRAKQKNVPFNLTPQDIYDIWPIDGKCPKSGLDLDASSGYTSTSPALDRIDPALGYVPGNIQLVSGFVNNAKGNMPEDMFNDMFLTVSKFVVSNE